MFTPICSIGIYWKSNTGQYSTPGFDQVICITSQLGVVYLLNEGEQLLNYLFNQLLDHTELKNME